MGKGVVSNLSINKFEFNDSIFVTIVVLEFKPSFMRIPPITPAKEISCANYESSIS
jgi:hypothetical protein